MRRMMVAIALVGLICLSPNVLANTETTLLMHAVETSFGSCVIDDPCDPGPPYVDVNLGSTIAAYLLVRNHAEVAGVQTAFEWGQWAFLFGLWNCQVTQVLGVVPASPGGATAGTIATAFNGITGPGTAVIGRMHLIATSPGCILQVMSSYPFGNHVVATGGIATEIIEECWGRICAGTGTGLDVCAPCDGAVPAEPSTWGSIKAQYN